MTGLLLLLVSVGASPDHIAGTELFQVMRTDEVFVRPDGEVYVLDFDEARIQHYDAEGQLKGYIGRRGKGPGEFTYPTYVNLVGDFLYVFDELTNLVSVFDTEGTFKHHLRLPRDRITMIRAGGGWFFYEADPNAVTGAPSVLEFSAEDFDHRAELAKIKTTGWSRGTSIESDGSNVRITFAPLDYRPVMAVSQSGARCYFAHVETFRIEVFDGKTGKHVLTMQDQLKPVPFDLEWADEQYEEGTENTRRRRPGAKIQKLYPEYFPAVRTMAFDPDGNLVVDLWVGRPDDRNHPIAFDKHGAQVPMRYDWEVSRRLVGTAGGFAYLVTFGEDAEAGIAKVPFDQTNQFVKDHPVTDWSRSRSISISN